MNKITSNPFQELTSTGYIETFFSDTPELDIDTLKVFLLNPENTDILFIRSLRGNGSTHLLGAATNLLMNRGKKFASMSCNGLERVYADQKEQFELYLESCEFFMIDSLPYVTERPEVFSWLKNILLKFMSNNGKVIVTSNNKLTKEDLINYFKTTKIKSVNLSFMPLSVLKRASQIHATSDIVEKNAEQVYDESSSNRDFINQMISLQAQQNISKQVIC